VTGEAGRPALAQFLFGWSAHGLFGTGYGIRAASSDLLRLSRDGWQPYLAFCDYMPQAERQAAPDPPVVIARYRLSAGGYLIARKRPTGRRDTYFVHGIVDPDGLVDPLAVASSGDAGFWLESDAHLDAAEKALPGFDVASWEGIGGADAVAAPALTADELAELVSSFVVASAARTPVAVAGRGMTALPRIRALLWMLPASVGADLCFSTYETLDRPAALDVVASDDPPRPPAPPEWVRLLAELAHERPAAVSALRADGRVLNLVDYAALVAAAHGPLAAGSLRTALEHRSPFLADMASRPELAPALLDAIEAAPGWWESAGLERVLELPLDGDILDQRAVLERAVARGAAGDAGAASALVTLYRAREANLGGRLADLERIRAAGAQVVDELPALLLSDQPELPEDAIAAWLPMLVTSWSRLASVLDALPPWLRPRVLVKTLMEGDADAAAELGRQRAALIFDAIATAAPEPAAGERAARFLVDFAMTQPDPSRTLQDALQHSLHPPFVRGELAGRLSDVADVVTPALRQDLLWAGTADFPAFHRLVARIPRASQPVPRPDASPEERSRLGRLLPRR
jgi:hypothetical protein